MPNCQYYKKCGGCQLQNLEYREQLSMKQARVIRLLGRYCHIDEIIGMEQPYHYRNKVQAAFAFKNGRIYSGIYQASTRRVVQAEGCMLEDEAAAQIIKTIENLAASFKIKAYDLATRRGFLRHILIRRGFISGEIMVVIVTAKGTIPSKEAFIKTLTARHPEITTVVWNINESETPLFLGDRDEVLYGNGYITDSLCGLSFRISPKSFYQVNPVQTEKLYKFARDFASLSGKETVIDAYCGTGTIGLTMASSAKELIGVEINGDAVKDAKANAALNNITNAEFYAADAGDFMFKAAQNGEKVDVVITDPPRTGCSKRFLESLITLNPERIVYVSCNPETLSRDLFALRKGGYRVKKIQPVDMFPFTSHIECVVSLIRQ